MRKTKQKNSVKKINKLTVKDLSDKLKKYSSQKDSKFYQEMMKMYNERVGIVATK